MADNPYTLTFGKVPRCYVERTVQRAEITEQLLSEEPSQQVFFISSVRGSGKTCLMTHIQKEYREKKDWIVIELNSNSDLLQEFTAALYNNPIMKAAFPKYDFSLSVLGIKASFTESVPASSYELALDRMCDIAQKMKKKILVAIDEVTNTASMRLFCSSFSILIRKDYPLFLVMTGLPNNVENLRNVKGLTFLFRANPMKLKPLNFTLCRQAYMDALKVPFEVADEMAAIIKGYSYAFQQMGYIAYEHRGFKNVNELLPYFDSALQDTVYNKVWSEISATEKRIVRCMVENRCNDEKSIKKIAKIDANAMSVYRARLITKGVLSDSSDRGVLEFALPRFEEFVRNVGE